jgi:hypothetical protein
MDEQTRRLWSSYDAAIKKIASGKAGASGGFEDEYAKAYQRLVAAGLAMQIKRKYRAR